MLYSALKTLHILAIIVWVGGMVFAHFYLRPAVATLDAPARLRLMHDILSRFFRDVLAAALITLATGLWMIGRAAKTTVQAGGSFQMPLDWTIMATIGIVMVLIFLYIRLRLFPAFARAILSADWPVAGGVLAQIRQWVSINLGLGAVTVVVALML